MHMATRALGPRSLCGVQTGGSVDGVCIIQECVCRRYGGERRTIVMHMFRADAVPHTTTLSLPFSLSSSLLSPFFLPTSFQCTLLIFWPLANTDTIEKSVVLHTAAESLFPSPISTSSRKKFARYCFSTESNESLSRNVEEIDYVLSDTGHN